MVGLLLALGIFMFTANQRLQAWLPIAIPIIIAKYGRSCSCPWDFSNFRTSRPYRSRDQDAGRWLEAPVAELDKTTIGKLLTSRASRDPGLRVVVNHTPSPTCTDALYDVELDG